MGYMGYGSGVGLWEVSRRGSLGWARSRKAGAFLPRDETVGEVVLLTIALRQLFDSRPGIKRICADRSVRSRSWAVIMKARSSPLLAAPRAWSEASPLGVKG